MLAISLLLVATLGFDVMAIFVRILSAKGYSAFELSAYRNIIGVIPSIIALIWMGEIRLSRKSLYIERWRLALLRGFLVALAQLCFYAALTQLELATVSALMQTHALFVVLVAVVLLAEKVGAWRISALIIGFSGAVLVMQPGSDTFSVAALLPVIAAFFYAVTIVTVRLFDASIPSALLYVYSSIASGTGALILALFASGFSPIGSSVELLMIIVMALSGGCAVLLLMLVYRMAAPSALAPFSYFGILTAFTFGWFVFGEAPVEKLFPGVILIVGAGILVIWREHSNSKARK